MLSTWIHAAGKYLGQGFSETTATAPLWAASSTNMFPSVVNPLTAKNADEGATLRLSAMRLFISAFLSPVILTAFTALARSSAV